MKEPGLISDPYIRDIFGYIWVPLGFYWRNIGVILGFYLDKHYATRIPSCTKEQVWGFSVSYQLVAFRGVGAEDFANPKP